MSHALHSIACHGYGVAAVLYLAYLVRQWRPLAVAGRVLVGSGLALHAVALVSSLAAQQGRPLGIEQGCSILAFLLLSIYLLLDARYRRPVLGAFLVPLSLVALVPGILLSSGYRPPPSLKAPLLPLHISVALLGLAAFAVAAGVAGMYLLLERQVKGKHFGLLFSRLPPLEFLDDLNHRLVLWGFIALSVTVVTGAFFVSGKGIFWAWEPKEIASVVAWVGFGALLYARFLAGWRGKRVALMTMAGFCLLLVSFVTSFEAQGSGWRGGP
jgi:ABC-type uncharacterized transport system permease subunit